MNLLENLIAHWKLDEFSGTRYDSHGSNHLSDNGAVEGRPGKLGRAARFIRTDTQYLSLSDNDDISLGTNTQHTWACWFRLGDLDINQPLICKSAGGGVAHEYVLSVNTNGTVSYRIANGASNVTLVSNVIVEIDKWYFVLGWYDGTKLYLSVNGDVTETDWSSGTMNGGASLNLGRFTHSTSGRLTGYIDSVSFWKRVLTEEERTFLYNDGEGRDYPFLLERSPKQVFDFSVGTVSTGYSATSGLIELSTDEGLKFPNSFKPYYVVWWNSTDYSDPSDDPNREIVKVYKKDGDKLFILRGQQGTSPSLKNLTDKTYKIAQIVDRDFINKKLLVFKNPAQGSYYFTDFQNANIGRNYTEIFAESASATAPADKFKFGVLRFTTTSSKNFYIPLTNFPFNAYDLELTYWVKLLQTSETNQFTFTCGFTNSSSTTGAASNNAIFFYDYNSRNWKYRIRDNSTDIQNVDTGVRAKINTWYELKIKTFKDNQVEFYINKTLIGRHVGALPQNSSVGTSITIWSNDSSSVSFDLDAYELIAKFNELRTPQVYNSYLV